MLLVYSGLLFRRYAIPESALGFLWESVGIKNIAFFEVGWLVGRRVAESALQVSRAGEVLFSLVSEPPSGLDLSFPKPFVGYECKAEEADA